MKFAFICPGQGSQKVGMGQDFYENSDLAKNYFNSANEILGTDIQSIMFEGPGERLKQTRYTQPALYILSVIIGTLILEKGLKPVAAAGHSLGEYSAYALAGALDYETGLKLVKVRAESMQKAGEESPGTMAAIIGLQDDAISKITEKAAGIVVAANFNSPGQIVISGEITAVEEAMTLAKEGGARLVKRLNVSGAFHSPLMSSALDTLAEMIDSIEIMDAMIPVYSNVSAMPITNAVEIRSAMVRQLDHPVLWSRTISNMANDQVDHFMEVGSGCVLQGLCKRIDRTVKTSGIENWKQLQDV